MVRAARSGVKPRAFSFRENARAGNFILTGSFPGGHHRAVSGKPVGRLGLILPNQGVVFGATTVGELLRMAELADQSEVFDSVWVGDSLLAKPRMESVTLLSAIAARTRRVRLGTACMASFPLRHPIVLAAQWASLDRLAEGRTILVVCLGGGRGGVEGDFDREYEAFAIPPAERAARLEEGIEVLRVLWARERTSWSGRFFRFREISVRPRPGATPPIWIANNPHLFAAAGGALAERALDRVARLADGWMTAFATPEQFRRTWGDIQERVRRHGRDPAAFETALYYGTQVDDKPEAAFREAKRFLDTYYGGDFGEDRIRLWTAYGTPDECAAGVRRYVEAGVQNLLLRFASYDQMTQLRRFIDEVYPRI